MKGFYNYIISRQKNAYNTCWRTRKPTYYTQNHSYWNKVEYQREDNQKNKAKPSNPRYSPLENAETERNNKPIPHTFM